MRTFLRGKVTLLFMTLGLLLAVPAIALADDIYNNLDTTVDATAEVMSLQVGATTGNTTQLAVITQNGDGKNGCNISGGNGSSVTFPVSSSAPSVATVSPSSVTFGGCGDIKTLTVTPLSQGSTTISLGTPTTTGGTSGTFNVNPATFTVNVTDPPPANTPPQVTVSGVTEAALYNKGSVPSATCQVIDAEDGNSSFAATLSAITGTYASDGIGSQTASCSYTDGGGLMASSSKTYSIVDPSAPVITKVVTPTDPDGENGWYTSNVTVDWTVSDPESPNSLTTNGCNDQSITTDQAATTYSCSATSAGGSSGPQSVTIKRDATDPTINHTLSPAANTNGWNNSDVTVSFQCSDETSGVPAGNCPADVVLSEGADQSVTRSVTDAAGNTASDTVSDIDIDKTDPNVALVGGPANGSSHYFGSVPAAPTCTASDALSGLAGPCQVNGYGTTVGSHTVTASATDNADNNAEASSTYTVLAWTTKGFYQPVDMGGVYNTVKGGSTVPLKFELFAGTNELTSTSDITSLTYAKTSCAAATTEDAIETLATGGTSLRYDTTGGQFIYNWKTPTGQGCYKVTMTADDGSTISAYFKTK